MREAAKEHVLQRGELFVNRVGYIFIAVPKGVYPPAGYGIYILFAILIPKQCTIATGYLYRNRRGFVLGVGVPEGAIVIFQCFNFKWQSYRVTELQSSK